MTIHTPLWLTGGEYEAVDDRFFIEQIMNLTERVFRGLYVGQRAAGANFSVDVGAGAACILGATGQGAYFVYSDAVENLAMPTKPGSNSRWDLVVLQVNDPAAGGASGDNATLIVVQGTSAASPVPPAVPSAAVLLAAVLRTSAEGSVLNAAITDRRPLGAWPINVVTGVPTTPGVPGDLYVVIPT